MAFAAWKNYAILKIVKGEETPITSEEIEYEESEEGEEEISERELQEVLEEQDEGAENYNPIQELSKSKEDDSILRNQVSKSPLNQASFCDPESPVPIDEYLQIVETIGG
jgi:hypothetical protein